MVILQGLGYIVSKLIRQILEEEDMKRNLLTTFFLITAVIFISCGGSGSFLMEQGKIDKNDGRFDSAIENFEAELEQNPANAEAYYWMGYIYTKQQKWQKMADAYAKADELSDEFDEKIDEALETLFVRFFNKSISVMEDTTSEKTVEEKTKSALAWLDQAMIVYPDDFRSYKRAAILNNKIQEKDKALEFGLEAVEHAVNADESNETILMLMGFVLELYVEKDDHDKIIEWSRKLMSTIDMEDASEAMIDDYFLFGASNLAASLNEQGKTAEAEQVYSEAVAKYPDNKLLMLNLAQMLTNRKDYNAAMEIYKKLLNKDLEKQQAKRVNLQVGLMLRIQADDIENDEALKKTKYKEAIKHLEKVIEIDPDNQMVPDNMAAYQSLPALYFGIGDQIKGNEARQKYLEYKKSR